MAGEHETADEQDAVNVDVLHVAAADDVGGAVEVGVEVGVGVGADDDAVVEVEIVDDDDDVVVVVVVVVAAAAEVRSICMLLEQTGVAGDHAY